MTAKSTNSGLTDDEVTQQFSSLSEQAQAVATLMGKAQHQISFFIHHLEHDLYEQERVIQDLKRVVTRHQNNQIRLCVQHHLYDGRGSPGFLRLLDRLPSRCQVRQPCEEHQDLATNYVLVDDQHYLRQPVYWKPEGHLHLNDPAECVLLRQSFDIIWTQAGPHPEFKRLNI